jgi:hypothetical protein
MRFANSKGWVCREPVTYSAEQVRLWLYDGKPVFPLHFDAPDRPPTNYSVTHFPRNIDGDSWVTQCDSGWTRVEPGSGSAETAFGYIQIEKSGLRLAVYHLWGEI